MRARLDTISDYSALGAIVGRRAGQAVPYFADLPLDAVGDPLVEEKLKALGAAMAATGAVGLFHVADVTPEARAAAMLAPAYERLVIDDVAPGYASLSDDVDRVDLVWIGCPHASLREIALVAEALRDRRVQILWVTCARPVRAIAVEQGLVSVIESAGGRVFSDACMGIAPLHDLGFSAVATPRPRAFYLRNLAHVAARFAPLEACIAIAAGDR